MNEKSITSLAIIALAYFGVIKPLTDKLGLTKNAKDKADDLAAEQTENAKGWNPNFWLKVPKGTIILRDASATALAKQINNAWGTFNDDENAIYAVFRSLKNQAQLSQLCYKYNQLYQTDLLTRLRNPWNKWDDGLDPDEFAIVAKIVNKLPEITQ